MKAHLRVRAFGRRDEWQRTQVLEKVWTLFGWPVWVREIDREEVPSHVLIEVGALGSTDWRSKWCGQGGIWWGRKSGYIQR